MVIGASGHARCVIDAARAGSTGEVVAVADDDVVPTAREVLGVPVVGGSDSVGEWWSEGRIDGVVVGIGDNDTRMVVVERLLAIEPSLRFSTVAHPTASIAASARLGDGAVVLAGASVGPQASVGAHALLGAQANLDHDTVLSEGASLGPGALIGGAARIGCASVVGIGAVVRHGLTIGNHSVLGAGAVLTRDLPDGVVAWGASARIQRSREPGERYL